MFKDSTYGGMMNHTHLGKTIPCPETYDPNYLIALPRSGQRMEIGVLKDPPPFFGFDEWRHYEVSWLNPKGKPNVAIARIIYDCHSSLMVESKSLKLYFNGFNQSVFDHSDQVTQIIESDLCQLLQTSVQVRLTDLSVTPFAPIEPQFQGISLDPLDVSCQDYSINPNLLTTHTDTVEETLCSNLLRSNCLVTHQPDWGSVQIHYKGKKIDHGQLLKYLVSYRQHQEFHEQCIERIYMDIQSRCQPEALTVDARFTRRGGIDINPCRSSHPVIPKKNIHRLNRQ